MSFLLNKNVIVGGIVLVACLGLWYYIYSLKSDINDLQFQVSTIQTKLANKNLEVERLENSLNKQSALVEALEVDRNSSLTKLQEWKNKPAEVRYKTIYKTIYKEGVVKSNECKDIKSMLNDVKLINFNSL